MSLGSDLGTPDSIDSIAANAAAQSGVVIVASAGNAGPGAYMAGAPANATRVISVGAVDAAEFVADGVIADFPGSATDVGGFNMYGSDLPVTGTHRVLLDGDSLSLGCSPDDFADVEPGDIVTISRGDCAFSDKRGNAQAAGAAGVILVNNEDATLINPVPDPEHDIPMVSTRPGNAEALVENDGLSVTLHAGDVPNEEFGQMAEFSSAGPARYSDMIKPDVSAPGVQVMSTDGASANKGKLLGGTSMASPQVAGAAALVLQAHPGWTTAHVKGAIVGSADPSLVDPYTVRRVGSGIVNARKAATTNSWAESNDDAGTPA